MTRHWLFCWLIALFSLSGCDRPGAAAPPTAEPKAAARAESQALPEPESAASPQAKSFLWEVSSPTARVFLLGSIHVAKAGLYPLAPSIEDAYASSDTLVLEVYLAREAEAQAALKSAQLGMYPEGDSIDKHVSPETFASYSSYLAARNKPLLVYGRMRPWLASVALVVESLAQEGYDPELGIDRYFQNKAEQDGKRIEALESIDEQLNTLAGLDDRTQELMLLEFLKSDQKTGKELDLAFDAWRRGDAASVEELLLGSITRQEYLPVYQKVFVERNLRMTAKLLEVLAGGGTRFVVVGSGHLVGRDGIVELLRQQRHEVTQL